MPSMLDLALATDSPRAVLSRSHISQLAVLVDELSIVEVTEQLIAEAADLAEQESLRGCDAVHLASALTIGAELVTSADAALCEAAARRGLHVANPLDV